MKTTNLSADQYKDKLLKKIKRKTDSLRFHVEDITHNFTLQCKLCQEWGSLWDAYYLIKGTGTTTTKRGACKK